MPEITAIQKPVTKEKELEEEKKSDSRPMTPDTSFFMNSLKIGKERSSITVDASQDEVIL